ncbi:hypothetical protein [Pseudomonas gingeri]|uniref:hypothetical protein n=1 Tax=Pseudomonas gingeri TaxID=117681 RepID=UPI0015A2B978|nr:hypothetical protein [Pseudomonas gingeri]NVZ26326.1 hypothetical protein [Pseudomonas gingeri]NWA10830.1 hypothetical protein [Pseudomonas gingeri]
MSVKTQQTEAQIYRVHDRLSTVQRWNARLEALQAPEAAHRLQLLLAAKGRLIRRPEAGVSF